MRLLFLNYEFPPVGGGAAYASLATARELVALGHQVDFLTAGSQGFGRDEKIDGVQVFRVRSHRRSVHDSGIIGTLAFIGFAAPRLRELAKQKQYDAYHYYFGLPTGLLSRVPGPHRSKPYVISLRGSDVPKYDQKLDIYHCLMRPITHRIWRGAHRIIANSNNLCALAKAAMPGVNIDVILNGASPPEPKHTKQQRKSGIRILTVGRLIERKGIDTLITALAKSPNRQLSLDIAGDGPRGPALRKLAFSFGIADRVRFCGYVDRAALDSLYANADVFALISRTESCSMAILEAMAAGLPIIASNVGGNIELVQDHVNGVLVDPDNVDKLLFALNSLAGSAPLRVRLGAANQMLVERKFSWRAVAKQYEDVFRKTMMAHVGSFHDEI